MSEKELIEHIEQNLENSPMVDTETGISAVKELAKVAEIKFLQPESVKL